METKTAQITLRQAKKRDVLDIATKTLRHGVQYYVQSKINPEQLCGPATIGDHTDPKEFSHWFSEKLLWVPVSALVNPAAFVNENQFKQAS